MRHVLGAVSVFYALVACGCQSVGPEGASPASQTTTQGAGTMADAPDRIETERLIIRGFTHDDWPAIQAFAKDLATSDAAKYDHRWPTSEEGCKGAAGYFVKRKGSSWAVCLKTDKRLVGYISFDLNATDDPKPRELGHVFHTQFYSQDYDTEALGRLMDHAFTHLGTRSIHANNAAEWTVQLAPLKKLGMRIDVRGKSSFHKNPDGTPIEFTGSRAEITREEWMRRKHRGTP